MCWIRSAMPRTVSLSDDVALNRFTLNRFFAYRAVQITEEQRAYIPLRPLKLLFRVLTGLGEGNLYLIEKNETVCGYICLWVNPSLEKHVIAPLVIDRAAQGKGLGTAVLFAACERMFEAGARSVALAVHPDNAAAIRLYERAGFRFTGGKWGKTDRVMRLDVDARTRF